MGITDDELEAVMRNLDLGSQSLNCQKRQITIKFLGKDYDREMYVVTALHQALSRYEAPHIFHSDKARSMPVGSTLNCCWITVCSSACPIRVNPPRTGWPNAFMRTLKEEHVDYTEYRDYEDALTQ